MTLTGFEPSSANCATTTALRYDACCLSSTRRPFNIFRLSQHEKGVLTIHIILFRYKSIPNQKVKVQNILTEVKTKIKIR